jgi:PadR family transcriptional regulator PadR
MPKRRVNPDFINGVPELLLLKLLSVRPMYGYELVTAIRESSGEEFQFGEGSIYPILHRLEKEKALAGTREVTNGRKRVVYRLTASGQKRLQSSTETWSRITSAIRLVLEGGTDVSLAST